LKKSAIFLRNEFRVIGAVFTVYVSSSVVTFFGSLIDSISRVLLANGLGIGVWKNILYAGSLMHILEAHVLSTQFY
jgi:riboflavin transporter FmnP